MPSYRLHYFPESGNSYKLALMLTLCGQSFEPVWADFGGGVTRTPEWRRDVNAMGESRCSRSTVSASPRPRRSC
jgi:glutathione S-transferase